MNITIKQYRTLLYTVGAYVELAIAICVASNRLALIIHQTCMDRIIFKHVRVHYE